jgi:brefeldin A-inhibited guanine nucleotide-exchange protein
MKEKNLACIRTLLSIAVIDGEHLGESWGPVLQCISQIARLRLTASGLDSDESFLLVEREKPKKTAPMASRVELFRSQPSKGEIAREAEESNAQAVLEAVQEVLIDKVFSSTVQLSACSLAHFIEQLIIVSKSEIQGNSKSGITGVNSSREADDVGSSIHSKSGTDGPSVFSLQRLVEVADFNMDVRPRLVWAQIWGKMSDFFAKIACAKNSRVSFFAIDSLKQLSSKFLEKPELSEFNFQRTFLNPFLVVMEDKESKEEIREMVLQCVDHVVQTKSRNLRSGWITIFMILRRSASDPGAKIESLGISILQRLLDEHLSELCSLATGEETNEATEEMPLAEKRQRNSNVDDFIGLCRASLSFVRQEESDSPRPLELSMRAFSHIAIYADLLADHRVLPPVSGAQVRATKEEISSSTSTPDSSYSLFARVHRPSVVGVHLCWTFRE